MLSRLFVFLSGLIALLAVTGTLLGYFGMLTFGLSLYAFFFSLFVAYFFTKKIGSLGLTKKQLLISIAAPAAFALILFTVSLQDSTYPLTCTDFMNHAANVRLVAQNNGIDWKELSLSGNPLPFSHRMPQELYAAGAIIYKLFDWIFTPYSLLTLLTILFLSLSGLGAFLAGMKIFNDFRSAILGAFAFQFFIGNFYIIDSGFLTQAMGQFFLVSAFYLHQGKKDWNYILALSGLAVYPHFAAIMYGYILLELLLNH